MIDENGSADFANEVVEQTLGLIRDQEDMQGLQQAEGQITFNPSVFGYASYDAKTLADNLEKSGKRYLVLGPYQFTTRFSTAPRIVFGQVAEYSGTQIAVGIPTKYTPFMAHIHVYNYTFTNGEVDGFYVGLYALSPPPSGIANHTINWVAVGQASRYGENGNDEGWTDNFDYNEPEFLEDDVTDVQPYYNEEDYVE